VEGASDGNRDSRSRQPDLVVIGASAGGVEALQAMVKNLPAEFPAAVLVVLHVASAATSVLPQILSRKGPLPATFASDGDELRPGQIYVAPSDHHMLVDDGRIRLTRGPRENGHRPAIDPLFRSAARSADGRCIGVILSGLLDDGAEGLRFIKASGGGAVVQDPDDAHYPSMPEAALGLTAVDRVVPADQMAEALCALIEDPPHRVRAEHPAALVIEECDVDGPPSGLTCPECGGALWEKDDGPNVRYACHVGHAYSIASLLEEQGRSLETILWSAVRALEERAEMHRRLAQRASGARSQLHEDRAHEAAQHAAGLRRMLAATGRVAVPAPERS
jgi:two-component system chemotaxis response regulator CheB